MSVSKGLHYTARCFAFLKWKKREVNQFSVIWCHFLFSSPGKSFCRSTKWVKDEKTNLGDEKARKKCLFAMYHLCDVGVLHLSVPHFFLSYMGKTLISQCSGGELPRIPLGNITDRGWERKGPKWMSTSTKPCFMLGFYWFWTKYSLETVFLNQWTAR